MFFGYVRVSSRDQNEDRQYIALRSQGVPDRNIYDDRISGKDFIRPGYRRMLRRLRKDDVLFISSIDRLGRNYEEILEQWRILTKEKQIAIVVLDMPLLDTRKSKDLTNVLIADIVLQLLSYVAQKERENIRSRQAEGIRAAKLKGIRFGRPVIPLPDDFDKIYTRYIDDLISGTQAARELHMPESTFRYKVKKYRETMK